MSEGVFAHWPNRLTALRFVGALVLFAGLQLFGADAPADMGTWLPVCFFLFLVVAATDAADGYIARKYGQITAFGRVADPFVDKILVLGTLIFLTTMDWSATYIPAWIVVVVLAREFLVTGLRGYVESLGVEFPADWFGKIKMILQCIAISIVLGMDAFPWPDALRTFWGWTAHAFVWGTLVTAAGSGVTYVLRSRDLIRQHAAGGGAA